MPFRTQQISPASRALHYILLLSTLAAWCDAVWPQAAARSWTDHRLFGLTAASVTAAAWIVTMREGVFRGWLQSFGALLGDARALVCGGTPLGSREQLLRSFVPPILIAVTLVLLLGLPGVYRLDGLFQPAAWVLRLRRVHALAGYALTGLCVIELSTLGVVSLRSRGQRRALPA